MKRLALFFLNSKSGHFAIALFSILQFPLFFWRFEKLFRKSGAITYFGIVFLVFLSASLIASWFKSSLYFGRAALIIFFLLCLSLALGIDQRSFKTKLMKWKSDMLIEEGINPLTLKDPVVSLSLPTHPDLSVKICSGRALKYLMEKGEDAVVKVEFEITYDFGKIVDTAVDALDGRRFCYDYPKYLCPPNSFPVDCVQHNGLMRTGSTEVTWFELFEEESN